MTEQSDNWLKLRLIGLRGKMSQRKFADHVGLTREQYPKYEQRGSAPLHALRKIAKKCGVPSAYLTDPEFAAAPQNGQESDTQNTRNGLYQPATIEGAGSPGRDRPMELQTILDGLETLPDKDLKTLEWALRKERESRREPPSNPMKARAR